MEKFKGTASEPQKFYDPYEFDKKKIVKFQESGHKWIEDEDGYVDTFAYSAGHHNGPKCEVCGYYVCWHCVLTPKPCTAIQKALGGKDEN